MKLGDQVFYFEIDPDSCFGRDSVGYPAIHTAFHARMRWGRVIAIHDESEAVTVEVPGVFWNSLVVVPINRLWNNSNQAAADMLARINGPRIRFDESGKEGAP